MRLFVLSLATVAVFGLTIPYALPAMADPIVVLDHHHHHHHDHDHDRTVIIKHNG
jgi:hypothetical protein